MTDRINVIAVAAVLAVAGFVGLASAQDDNRPPAITIVNWERAANLGDDFFFGPFGDFTVVDPTTFNFLEGDIVRLELLIEDPDWADADNDEEGEEVFIRFRACPLQDPRYPTPEAPPIRESSLLFFPEEDGFAPGIGETTLTLFFSFQVPPFNGKNQGRLRGAIDWDVRYVIIVEAANDQEPEGDETVGDDDFAFTGCATPAAGTGFDAEIIEALESPRFGPANPPPFADAGGDRTVEVGTTVVLDARQSFDAFNEGFDASNPDIFEKDTITYAWEWQSGPSFVNPVQANATDPTATAELTELGTYSFRVTVSDTANAETNSAIVEIEVVEELPTNTPPIARVEFPDQAIVVGDIITLDASASTDLDGDELMYRWIQTNELGGRLAADELSRVFQPLSGIESATSTWQAVSPGTFYFRLLVSDGQLQDEQFFSLEVQPQGTAGDVASADPPATDGGEGGAENDALPPELNGMPACGGSLLPLAVLPFWLAFLKPRR